MVGIIIWRAGCSSVESFNRSIDDKKAALERKAKEDIKKAYEEADKKTREEIERYDREVMNYFKKIKNNRDSLNRMVDFTCQLFDSALSDAVSRSSNTERFVVLDFYYTVSMVNIIYTGDAYGMYDFKTQRYRNLDKDTECEALAAALMKMIGGYVLKKYSSVQGQLKYGNTDASVSLHFEMPNKNFIPATVIV